MKGRAFQAIRKMAQPTTMLNSSARLWNSR